MKNWKRVSLLLLSLVLLSGMTNVSALAEDKPVEVIVWKRLFEEWNQQFFLDCAEKYNAENRGYHITMEIVAENGFNELLNAARETGTAPVMYDNNHNYIAQMAARQEIMPLTGLLSEEAEKDVLKNVADVISYEGKLYGYPQFIELGNVLFYRKDMMEAAGITSVPKTWAELLEAGQKMTTPEVFGLEIPCWGDMQWTMWGWMLQSGHLALTDDWSAPNVKDYRDLCLFWRDCYATDAVPQQNLDAYTSVGSLCRGEVAMTICGSYGLGEIANSYPDVKDVIGIAAIPTKDGEPAPTSVYGGFSFVVDAKATPEQAAGAADFLTWMLHDPNVIGNFFELASFGKTPATISAAAWLAENEADNPYVEVLNYISSTAQSEPLHPWDITIATGLMLENVASGAMEVDEAIDQCEKTIQSIIESQKLAK